MQRYDAILPAGGRLEAEFAERVGTASKALISLGGETVLGSTLRSLRASGLIDRTVVIGPQAVLAHADAQLATIRLPEAPTGPENIFRGLDALTGDAHAARKVVVVTTDLPFLSPGIIERFISACPPDAGICVPLIRKSEFEARFPGVPATFVTLRDDTWTTGCIYLLDVQAMVSARKHIEHVFENRKSKFGMAKLLGVGFVLKWLTKQLTLADVEKKIETMLGCTGAAIVGSAPELAFDIDYPHDYDFALQHSATRVETKDPVPELEANAIQ